MFRNAPVNLAIALTTSDLVGKVLFSILGAQTDRECHSLPSPTRCPPSLNARKRFRLLISFDDDIADAEEDGCPPWLLFKLLGGNRTDAGQRLEARRAILQLSAAVVDYFELRMEKPPYRLLWLAKAALSPQVPSQVLKDFFKEPEGCLPLFCLRLEAAYPSKERFEVKAVDPLRCFGEGTFVSIDFSERAHAQFRHDVVSQTSGANFEATSNRLLVRQYVAAHVAAGGIDPAKKSALDILDAAGVAPALGGSQSGPKMRPSTIIV